jgi:hypothetical protein
MFVDRNFLQIFETEIYYFSSSHLKNNICCEVFWDLAPRSQVDIDRRLRGAYCLHNRPDDGGSTHL